MNREGINPAVEAAMVRVEADVKRSGSSFLTAMRLLPPERRSAMYALYAFCRVVDDVADEGDDVTLKRRQLAEWRAEVARTYDGVPETDIGLALLAPIAGYGLAREDFLALVDGMEMDAQPSVRLADDAELALYCDRVACAVGRLSNRIFGIEPALGDPLAGALGEALQLTNILRDLDEDAGRDRLYVPADMLGGLGIDGPEARAVIADPRFAEACTRIARLARTRYAEAATALARCDRRRVRPAAVMMEVYRRILDRLEARGWTRLSEPVSVPAAQKLWIVLRHGVL